LFKTILCFYTRVRVRVSGVRLKIRKWGCHGLPCGRDKEASNAGIKEYRLVAASMIDL